MSSFLELIVNLPTVIYTIMLVPVVAYWLFAILGLVDVELLDSADGVLEGGAEGALEAGAEGLLEAGAEGALEAGAEGLLEAGAEGALEAGAEGALEAGAEGALEGAGAQDAALSEGLLYALLSSMKLRAAPVSLVFSFIILYAWGLCAGGSYVILRLLELTLEGWTAAALWAGSTLLSLPLTSITVRPLAPVFVTHQGRSHRDLAGHSCTIRTGSVSSHFGQALCVDGSSDLLIEVRCDRGGEGLRRGSQALIVHFDPERQAFIVEPLR